MKNVTLMKQAATDVIDGITNCIGKDKRDTYDAIIGPSMQLARWVKEYFEEPLTDVEKAIGMYESQARLELDFCYEGGEREAMFIAKTLEEEYLEKRHRIKDNLGRLKIHLHKELGVTMQIERVVINTAVDAYFG